MSLLSLGLLKDEREEVVRQDVVAEGEGSGRELSRSSQDGSLGNRPAAVSKGVEGGAAESSALPSFDPVRPQKGADPSISSVKILGGRTYTGLSDKSVGPTQSQLPAAIEELRQRVSGNELPEA